LVVMLSFVKDDLSNSKQSIEQYYFI